MAFGTASLRDHLVGRRCAASRVYRVIQRKGAEVDGREGPDERIFARSCVVAKGGEGRAAGDRQTAEFVQSEVGRRHGVYLGVAQDGDER